ncbi:MAG: hypothetical protein ACLPIG_20150 [Methylocella sp.]
MALSAPVKALNVQRGPINSLTQTNFQAWNADWFPLPGQAVFDLNTQHVAAVSRDPGHLDLFVIGNDGGAGTTNGHVWTTTWSSATGWNADWGPLPGQAVFDRSTQKIAAVSRDPGNLDLFVIGNDGGAGTTNGHVWTTAWSSATGWNADWGPLPGQAVFDRNTQKIAAVSRAPGNLDLFVIGNDSHVWTTAWSSATGWNADWRPLPGQAVFDLDTQHVAAVSRAPDHLDLFVIGNDGGVGTTNGHVWTTAWSSATGWNADWGPLPGQAVFDRSTQKIAAVSRDPNHLDLFVIGNDSHVWTTAWSSATGWNVDWGPLPGQAVFDLNTQNIAAVSRDPGNLDLFVIGNDGGAGTTNGHVWTTAWSSATGWNADWGPLPGQAVFDRNTQKIAAVSRAPGNLDLFVIGNDSHVWTTFWGPHVANPAIGLSLVENSGGRFVEVAGTGFTPNQNVKLGYDITSGSGPTTHQTGEDNLASDQTGGFIDFIRVNLGDNISGAQVQATDVASGMTATASI